MDELLAHILPGVLECQDMLAPGAKVSKDALRDYLLDNGVKVKEVQDRSAGPRWGAIIDRINDAAQVALRSAPAIRSLGHLQLLPHRRLIPFDRPLPTG